MKLNKLKYEYFKSAFALCDFVNKKGIKKEFIVNGTNETINYRKLMNSVRKEMKNHEIFC